MQGINRIRHMHLLGALLQLEHLFSGIEPNLVASVLQTQSQSIQEISIFNELKFKRLELEQSYQVYLDMLDALALHIASHEDLFTSIKVHHVGNRLKKIKSR